MKRLKIVVCMKVVPKPEEIKVDPQTGWLKRTEVRSEINPPDMNAMEMALKIKDRYGCQVLILSMGPKFFTSYLRVPLAMGADHIYLLSDPAFAGADTLATTYTLAKGIEKLGGANLVFCGEESSDGATGQVPPGLAEWLGIQQLTMVTELDLDPHRHLVRGRREVKGGYEVLEVPLPAVISARTASNEPRFMDYRLKAWSMDENRVTIWDKEDLGAGEAFIGKAGSPTSVSKLIQAPEKSRKRIFLRGSPSEVAAQLAEILKAND